jgi:hypothetical protein
MWVITHAYLGTMDACQKSVSQVDEMAGTELMANPSKETYHLPTCKNKALTPYRTN